MGPMRHLLVLTLCTSLYGQITLNEICAVNNTTTEDLDGDSSDWIELANASPSIVNIGGYFLTDDPADLTKWQFPSPTLIGGSGYLLIFASDKNVTIGGQLHTNFKLSSAGDFLALVAADGSTTLSQIGSVYPPQYADVTYGRQGNTGPWTYLTNTTPGSSNPANGDTFVTDLTWSPALPSDSDNIVVSATAAPAPGATITGATLHYRTGFGPEATIPMSQSGNVWSALIPASVSGPGDMLRWRVQFSDSVGATAKGPLYPVPTDSPQYTGVMIPDPSVSTNLKSVYWFMQNPSLATTTSGGRASVWYEGALYDNIFVRRRGNSSSGWPKKNLKFDFNAGHHLQEPRFGDGAEEINVNSAWGDKSFIRQVLSFDLYEAAGAQTGRSFSIRVQLNGSFHSVASAVEQTDEPMLDRQGLDRRGALYKMYNTLNSSVSGVEKKTRLWENSSDLATLVSNIGLPTGPALETWLFDNVDVPAVISYLAATCVMHDNDHVHKNYYLYRDSDGDREWQFIPWDKDLTWGRNYTLTGGVLNDTIWSSIDPYSHPLFGDQNHPKNDGPWNRLIDACYRTPRFQQMYLRRLRSVMDEFLQAPGTPAAQLTMDARINQLQGLLGPDCALDQGLWGVPSYGSSSLTFTNATNQIKSTYLAPRRNHLYNTHGSSGTGLIPDPVSGPTLITITTAEPSLGNPEQAYIELHNCGTEAVDLSDWTISGGVSFTFPKSTVALPGEKLYVVEDVPAFRARSSGPSGGQGLLVAGKWSGALQPAESVLVFDNNNALITRTGEFNFFVTTTGVGDVTMGFTGASSLSPFWIPVSFNTTGPVGCGPILGLGSDAFLILALPQDTAPFNGVSNFGGSYFFSAPAGSLAPGLSADARSVVYNPMTGDWLLSDILRITF